MDSYDFGFYLDYQVLYVDFQDYKEDIRLEKKLIEYGKMKEYDIECEWLLWFYVFLLESLFLIFVQIEDLEEEIFWINKFFIIYEDKG